MYPNHGSLHLSQNDIESLGLGEADSVKISSPTGCVEMSFRVDDSLPTGLTFFPEHFSNPSLKDLIACTTDAVTGVPAFKSGPVTLEKHGLPSTAHAPKGDTTKPEIPEK
jgi:formate dehydrogenase alpha subunit